MYVLFRRNYETKTKPIWEDYIVSLVIQHLVKKVFSERKGTNSKHHSLKFCPGYLNFKIWEFFQLLPCPEP